eukprot:1158298-Pelagomonas_calceolata.AAC.9
MHGPIPDHVPHSDGHSMYLRQHQHVSARMGHAWSGPWLSYMLMAVLFMCVSFCLQVHTLGSHQSRRYAAKLALSCPVVL